MKGSFQAQLKQSSGRIGELNKKSIWFIEWPNLTFSLSSFFHLPPFLSDNLTLFRFILMTCILGCFWILSLFISNSNNPDDDHDDGGNINNNGSGHGRSNDGSDYVAIGGEDRIMTPTSSFFSQFDDINSRHYCISFDLSSMRLCLSLVVISFGMGLTLGKIFFSKK